MVKIENNKENLMKCICANCPSYNGCMKGEMQGLFCARERTSCGFVKKGCICGGCILTEEYQLDKGYYCNNAVL